MQSLTATVVFNNNIAPTVYHMRLASDYIAKNALPGQFVHIRVQQIDNHSPLLRRPISVCTADPAAGTFDIIYQVKGVGTYMLCEIAPNDMLEIVGPLGAGFDVFAHYDSIAAVGGGMGVYPLLFALQHAQAGQKTAYLGYRGQEYITLLPQFEAVADVVLSTDDGSVGHKGFATETFEKGILQHGRPGRAFVCGPMPMMKAVAGIAAEHNVPAQVSLEQRMACGFGACLTCTCAMKSDNARYQRVCIDGPVVEAADVDWGA